MSNNSILLINPDFDPSTASAHNLVIKIGFDSLSYAIIDHANSKVCAVFDEQECENIVGKLAEKLKVDAYLQLNYNSVKISAYTPNIVNIPTVLFAEEDITYHTQFFSDDDFKNVYVQPQGDLHTVFAFNSEIDELIGTHFPLAKWYHLSTNLVAQLYESGEQLMIDFTVGAFFVVLMKNQKLVFQQTYETANAEEFNYYLLLLIKQLNIGLRQTVVNLTGIINEGDDKHKAILQCFAQVHFKKPAASLSHEILEDMPAHYYTSLLALNGCE